MQRCALVTGGSGFVGSAVARRLVHEEWEVHVLVRPESDLSPLKECGSGVICHVHDGSTRSMMTIIGKCRPSVVFHLASMVSAEYRMDDIEPMIRANVTFGVQLAHAMASHDVRLLVNTGSFWQRFSGSSYNPVNLYAATKQAFEDLLQYYVEAEDLRVVSLTLYDVYGPNDQRPKIVNLLKEASVTGTPLDMSPGEQLIDLVHVDDVASAFLVAANFLLSGDAVGHQRFCVSSGAPVTLRELVDAIETVGPGRPNVVWGGRPYREREIMRPWVGQALPGWEPRIGLKEGLEGLFAF